MSGTWIRSGSTVNGRPARGTAGPRGETGPGADVTGAEIEAARDDAVAAQQAADAARDAAETARQGAAGAATAAVVSEATRPDGLIARAYSRGDAAYNVTDSSLRAWRLALAKAESNTANSSTWRSARISAGIDSYTQGAGVNSWTAPWASGLARLFTRFYPAAGSGIIHMITPSWFKQDGVGNVIDTRINMVGAWTSDNRGAYGSGALRATGTDKRLELTDEGTAFVVRYITGPDCGTISIQVDSHATVTVDTYSATAGDGEYVYANTAGGSTGGTALAAGSHVLKVTAPATGNMVVWGLEARVSDQGVRVTRSALSGTRIGDLATSEQTMKLVIDRAAPDLFILLGPTNDYLQQTAVATYKARLTTAVQRAQAAGASMLLVVASPPQDMSLTIGYASYVTAAYQVADEQDCALLDLQKRWVSYVAAQAAGVVGDTVGHPSIVGHRDIARAVFEVIAPKGGSTNVSAAVVLGSSQTFTARQTFGAGLDVAAGQTARFGGDTTISRDSGFVLSVNGHWKAQILSANAAANLGAVNAKAGSGRAVSAQGSDGVERAGFNVDGRFFVAAADMTSTAPGAATKGIKVIDSNGVVGYVPWTPA